MIKSAKFVVVFGLQCVSESLVLIFLQYLTRNQYKETPCSQIFINDKCKEEKIAEPFPQIKITPISVQPDIVKKFRI